MASNEEENPVELKVEEVGVLQQKEQNEEEAEEKHSGYKPSQKKKGQEEYNKEFLDKLDKAMEAEEKYSGYKPYQKIKKYSFLNQPQI